jgi:hypothetical protein
MMAVSLLFMSGIFCGTWVFQFHVYPICVDFSNIQLDQRLK